MYDFFGWSNPLITIVFNFYNADMDAMIEMHLFLIIYTWITFNKKMEEAT